MRIKKTKPTLALFAMGVIGGGNLGYGIPVLRDLFERLSRDYNIIFYSFSTIKPTNVPSGIKLRQTKLRLPGRLKFFWMSMKFIVDQILNPCQLIFAVSIYPTGLWSIRLGKIFNRKVMVQIIALEAVGLPDIGHGNLANPWLRKLTKEVCEKADVLIAVAEYQKTVAKTSLPTLRSIEVLPLRIDYRNFTYKKRSISHPVQFVHIAYYSPVKDQDTMFSAFAQVSQSVDCHLTVIGHGYNTPKVQQVLEKLQIADKVTFVGEVIQEEIPKCFEHAHILLHTARFETGCAVIQEAMASGVAVCGTRVGILSDLGDEFAMIAPVQDVEQLSEKILQLLKDQSLYDKLTMNAYRWITTYDSIWSYENYRRFMHSFLKSQDMVSE